MSLQKPKPTYATSERQYIAAGQKFKYFWLVFTSDRRQNKEVDTRIGKAK